MQIPLAHFHQMAGASAPLGGGCDSVWDQDAREALVRTMLQAERMIINELRYYLVPTFITNERIQLGLRGARSDWQNAEVSTRWKYVTALGTETLTLVEADALVDWQDWDSDPRSTEEVAVLGAGGMYDTLAACDDECDVAIFFRTDDGAPSAAHPYFEIKPSRVIIDSVTSSMEVILKAAQLVKPTLWNLTEADCVLSDEPEAWVYAFDTDNLVPRVDVYCRSVNAETPVTLYWDGSCTCTSPTRWKEVKAFGTETLTLVEADALVDWQDWDSDPRSTEEVAVLGAGGMYNTLAACDDECDVAIFFRTDDGAPSAAHPYFEIKPSRVIIDSVTSSMEVILKAAQLVKPTLWNLTEADCVLSDEPEAWVYAFDTDNLVPRVDVYCRSVNAETPVTLYWDGSCTCTSPCAHQTQDACAYVTDLERGTFCGRPATYSGGAHIYQAALFTTPPETLLVDYRAGYRLDPYSCHMDSSLERAVVKLTNALLPEPPCGYCDAAETIWKRDRTPVDPLTPEAAGMPWDIYSQGALDAWRIVKRLAAGRGGKLGR